MFILVHKIKIRGGKIMALEKVRNVLGEEIKVFVGWRWGIDNRYAWNSKFLTKNCPQCSCCIGREEAITIVRKVNFSKGRRRWSPPPEKTIIGLCDWGLRTQILHPRDKLRKCEFFGKKPSRD